MPNPKLNTIFIGIICILSIFIVLASFILLFIRPSQPIAPDVTTPGSVLMSEQTNPQSDKNVKTVLGVQQDTPQNSSTPKVKAAKKSISPTFLFTIIGIILVGIGLFF